MPNSTCDFASRRASAKHGAAHPEIHLTSAEKAHGIAALRATLAGFALSAELRADVAAGAVAMGRSAR